MTKFSGKIKILSIYDLEKSEKNKMLHLLPYSTSKTADEKNPEKKLSLIPPKRRVIGLIENKQMVPSWGFPRTPKI